METQIYRHPGDGRGPRPAEVSDYAEGVGTGLRRYGGKFEFFRDSLSIDFKENHTSICLIAKRWIDIRLVAKGTQLVLQPHHFVG